MKRAFIKIQVLVFAVLLFLSVGMTSALAASSSHSFSNDDWSGELSNLDWGQISISAEGPRLDWDHPILKILGKTIIPGVYLGVTLKIGVEGDFKVDIKNANLQDSVNLDTHITPNAADIWLSGKGMYKEKFTSDNILDYLSYVPFFLKGSIGGYFMAASTAPVEAEGHFNNMTTVTLATIGGASKQDNKTFTLTSVKPKEPNEKVTFFVGSDFEESVSAFEIDLKVIKLGPLADMNIHVLAGANVEATLEKDTIPLDAQGKGYGTTIHACVIKGEEGCVNGTENDITDDIVTVGIHIKGKVIGFNFTVFDHSWNLSDSYRMVHGNRKFVQSWAYNEKVKYQTECDHKYYRVPVKVIERNGTTETLVSGSSVSVAKQFKHSDMLGSGTTNSDGKTILYLPVEETNIGAVVEKSVDSGQKSHFHGSAVATAAGIKRNDEVVIVLGSKSDETQQIKVNKEWNIDTEDLDRPESIMVVIEKYDSTNKRWDIYEYKDANNKQKLAVGKLDASSHWTWTQTELPKFEYDITNPKKYFYRVRELKAGAEYNDDTYNSALSDTKAEIRRKLQENIVYDVFDYLYGDITPPLNPNEVNYRVNAYTTLTGEFVPEHETKYVVDYNSLYYDADGEGYYDDELCTITDTAIYDVDVSKRFIAPEGTILPQEVFLALTTMPKTGWADLAREAGIKAQRLPVINPYSGGMTLQELVDAGCVVNPNLRGFEELNLAVGRAYEGNDYTVHFRVGKYQNGIPMDFYCTELTGELFHDLMLFKFDLVIPFEANTLNDYYMIPGKAYALLDDDTRLIGTVINVKDGDPKHTIGGTKYWVNADPSVLADIDYIKIHVYEEGDEESTGYQEVAGSPVTVYSKDNVKPGATPEILNAWVWSLTSDAIDNTKTYIIGEEFKDSSQAYADQWFPLLHEYDIINTWTGTGNKIVRIQKFVDPAECISSLPDETKFEIKLLDSSRQVVKTFTLEHRDISPNKHLDIVATNSWVEILKYKLDETISGVGDNVFSPQYASVPVLSFENDKPVLTFAVTNRLKMDYKLHFEKEWMNIPNPTPSSMPSSVTVQLYQNYATPSEASTFTLPSPTPTPTPSSGSTEPTPTPTPWILDPDVTIPRLDDQGSPYVYTIKEEPIQGFASSWTSDISNVEWPTATSGSAKANLNFRLTNRWLRDEDKTDFTVKKIWNADPSLRPERIYLSIIGQDLAGDYHYMGSKDEPVTGSETYQYITFTDLPKVDEYGGDYTYFVLESHVSGYDTKYATPGEATPGEAELGDPNKVVDGYIINTLVGDCEIVVKKVLTGSKENAAPETFEFTIIPNVQSSQIPLPVEGQTFTIQGEGEITLHFPIDAIGDYAYTISETEGDTEGLTYDPSIRLLLIQVSEEGGQRTYKSWLKIQNSTSPTGQNTDTFIETDTVVFNNIYDNLQTLKVEKTWDIDLEQKDHPDSIKVVLQSLSYNMISEYYEKDTSLMEWKTEQIIELTAEKQWKGTFKEVPIQDVDAEGNPHEIHYRVRELKEEAIITQEIKNKLPGFLADLLNQDDPVVHAKEDIDKLSVQDLKKSGADTAERAYYFELTDVNRDSFAKKNLYDAPEVAYTVKEYQTIKGETVPEHKTKYDVKYELKDKKADITNTAILDTNIYKRWINFEDDEIPDSVYLTLMGRVKKDYLDMVPENIKRFAETYIPVINPLTNGMTLTDVVGIRIPEGLDGNVTGMSLAIAKATKDKNWHVDFKIKKYSMFGLPMEYQGAELSSGILKSLIKAVTGLDFPISINILGGYVSIPGDAICIPILDRDWELTSNVFNIKADIDPGPTPTPTPIPDPPVPPVPPGPPIPPTPPDPPIPTYDPPTPKENTPTPKGNTPTPSPTPTSSPSVRPVTGIKYWINDKPEDRPEWIKLHIYNGEKEIDGSPVVLEANRFGNSNVWPWVIFTKDKGPDSVYRITEEFPSDQEKYEQVWSKYRRTAEGLNVYNYWFGNKTPQVVVKKVWQGGAPSDTASATVKFSNIADTVRTISVTLDKRNNYAAEFALSDQDLNATDISQIKIEETSIDPTTYVPSYSGPVLSFNSDGTPVYTYTITNHPKENVAIIVNKEWAGDNVSVRPASLGLKLIKTSPEGTRTEYPFTMTPDSEGKWHWESGALDLPNVDDYGRLYSYSVEEATVPGYQMSMNFSRNGNSITFNLKNTWIPEKNRRNVRGKKIWYDNDDQFRARPETIRVVVLNNKYEPVSEVMELSSDDAEWYVPNLPKYDEDGNEITYFVVEEEIGGGYSTSYPKPYYDESANTVYCDVANTYTLRKQVTVEKTWKPSTDSPSSLAVYLYAGDYLRESVYLNADNNWRYVFEDLPVLDSDGNGIAYFVDEDIPEGYVETSTSEYDGLNEHFYLTNTRYLPGILALPVEKRIIGGLPQSGERETFTFKLTPIEGISEDGSNTPPMPVGGDTITITNKGTASFLIPFTSSGWFWYTVEELGGNNPDYEYDDRVVNVLVLAATQDEATKIDFYWGTDMETGDVIRFTNQSRQRLYTITYDPNGGMIDGSPERVSETYPYGTVIVIRDAPVWDGYIFKYWEGSRYDPGDLYTVLSDHLFVAQWTSLYTNPFTFTKVWDGTAGPEPEFTAYNPDGTPAGIHFGSPKKEGTIWTYQRWFIDNPDFYVVESVPSGYYASYTNVGKYAEVTDRCYNGGTIINHQLPPTGDQENLALWLILSAISCGILCVLFSRKRQ